MSSHFSCIGFPVDDMDAYWTLARRAAAEGIRFPVPDGGALVRWAPTLTPPSPAGRGKGGPEIWAQVNQTGEVTGATPFFATGEPHTLAITGIGEDPEEPLDGWIDGWLEPSEPDEPYSGAFPMRVGLVDFALARSRITTFPTTRRVEIAALTHEAELYENEAAYRTAPGEIYRPPLESFASTAHAGIDDAVEFAEATALVSGRVAQARLVINPVSEAPYWWMQVSLRSVTLHVFADRETLGKEPRTGNILGASFWLIGRTAEPGDEGTNANRE